MIRRLLCKLGFHVWKVYERGFGVQVAYCDHCGRKRGESEWSKRHG